ncbi:MAG: 50S ribosomal protein L24 [Candidatus Firestonebacteria bacterium]
MKLKTHLKKGDNVEVVSGDDKGKKGKILKVLKVNKGKHTYSKILVESVNFVKRHTKKSQKVPQGGIVQRESPINISNVMLVCPRCTKLTKIGIKFLTDGSKARMCKKCKEIIEG